MFYPTLLLSEDNIVGQELQTIIPFGDINQNPDLIRVEPNEKNSIGIDEVHDLIRVLAFKPFHEDRKVAVISRAHTLTLPAQQALLKTLEEPPENTQILLATSMPHKLLPTILSRVTKVGGQQTGKPADQQKDYARLCSLKISDCMRESDVWSKDKEKALNDLTILLAEVRDQYLSNPNVKLLADEKAVIQCIERLEHNVNAKLALDTLFFSLNKFE